LDAFLGFLLQTRLPQEQQVRLEIEEPPSLHRGQPSQPRASPVEPQAQPPRLSAWSAGQQERLQASPRVLSRQQERLQASPRVLSRQQERLQASPRVLSRQRAPPQAWPSQAERPQSPQGRLASAPVPGLGWQWMAERQASPPGWERYRQSEQPSQAWPQGLCPSGLRHQRLCLRSQVSPTPQPAWPQGVQPHPAQARAQAWPLEPQRPVLCPLSLSQPSLAPGQSRPLHRSLHPSPQPRALPSPQMEPGSRPGLSPAQATHPPRELRELFHPDAVASARVLAVRPSQRRCQHPPQSPDLSERDRRLVSVG
jgi:hypothetical protein